MTTSRAVNDPRSMFSQDSLAVFQPTLVWTSFNQLEPDCVKPAGEAAKGPEEENIYMHEI